MALDTNITGANLDAGGNVKTAVTLNPTYMGGVRMFSENDPGDALGTPTLRSPETSQDYRLRVGADSVWDEDVFNYVAQNFNKHKYTSTTMTITWVGGFMNTNAISSTGSGNACLIQTYRHFPMQGAGGIYCETSVAFTSTPVTNSTIDFGLYLPGATGAATPLDGIYFRVNSAGVTGVVNNNGTEQTQLLPFTYVANTVYKFLIAISQADVEFWIDDVLYAIIQKPAGAGASMYSASNPWAIRQHNTGVPSGPISAKVSNYHISFADMDNVRLWASNKSGQAMSGVAYSSGGPAGQTANNVLNTVPGTATLTASTAPATNNLGGSFVFAAPAGTENDFPLFAFLNPASTTSITGRNLVVRGIWIDTWNQVVAVATTPTIMQFSAAVGSTATSLATVDAASTRLPKRIHLGVHSYVVGAAVGYAPPRIDCNLDAPLVIEPGSYFHIILRIPVGTATATETFRGAVGVNAYWE
jgi:hypothetical protein